MINSKRILTYVFYGRCRREEDERGTKKAGNRMDEGAEEAKDKID
jgi:hypothetical protein